MDNLFILSGLLLIVVIFAIFFPIHSNTVHKTVPVIVRPSYWITPTGTSWYPPRHRYHYEYTSGPSYRHYYRHLNNLYRSNDNNRRRQRRYNNSPSPPPPTNTSNNKSPKLTKAPKSIKVAKVSKKEPFNYSYI